MKRIVLLSQVVLLSMAFVHQNAIADFWTTRTTSEESQPLTCPEEHLVTGMKCEGRYCDNIQLRCSGNVGSSDGSINTVFRQWRYYISEESPYTVFCRMSEIQDYFPYSQPFYGFVTGVSCRGRYCDDISLECAAVSDNGPDFGRCYWSSWVSEENGGTLNFPSNHHAIGMQCKGAYCDDKRFYVCPFVKPF